MKISSLAITLTLLVAMLAITAPGVFPQTTREVQRELGALDARTRSLEDFRGDVNALKLDSRVNAIEQKLTMVFDQMLTLTRIIWAFLAGLVVFFLREFYGQVRKAKPDG